MVPDSVWDDLLEALDHKKVIPILGAGLLTFHNGNNLYESVATELLNETNLRLQPSTCDLTLNNAVITISKEKPEYKIKNRIYTIYHKLTESIPNPLIQLAKIESIQLFVTTTFDSYITKAIKNHRGPKNTREIIFSSSLGWTDIDPYEIIIQQNQTVIVNIFGKISRYSEYVITDENLLEAIIRLYTTKAERLPNFFDSMKNNELLFIGCNFSDWLGKFFIRAITNTKFLDPEQPQKYISDAIDLLNLNYTYFIQNHKGYIFDLSPTDFIAELYKRWERRQVNLDSTYKKFIFISYSHENQEKAEEIKAAIEQECPGHVWFDNGSLHYGDNYESIIKENIKDCALFVPLISHFTIEAYKVIPDPYFKKEWIWAKRGRYDMIESDQFSKDSFICPLLIEEDIDLKRLPWREECFGPVTIQRCISKEEIKVFAEWIKIKLFTSN